MQLPVNSLDLSSQKTKGSVGRSGSIGGRRPPSRPRSLINQSSNTSAFEEESPAFQFYQHLHQQAREEMYKDISNFANRSHSFNGSTKDSDAESDRSGVVITDVTNLSPSESFTKNNLTRQKSCSNENLAVDSNTESLLRRSSKVRRSLQCHKPSYGNVDGDTADEFEVSPTKSLKERAAEIEKLLRHGSSTYMSPNSDRPSESFGKVKFLKTKDSFISAETLKEVRDRLKKPNLSDNELKDDGIVTEKNDYGVYSKLNNFENDMQSVNCVNKKPNINGTGSLESRYSNKNSANGSRTSEWYRRRKSYGFEQVDEYEKFDKFNKKKNHMDSSTDSGICQSSETMGIPSWNKNLEPTWSKISPESTMSVKKDPVSATVTVRVKKDAADTFSHSVTSQTSNHSFDKAVNSVYLDGHGVDAFLTDKEDFKKIDNKKAVFKHNYNNESLPGESVWNKKSPIPFYKTSETRENLKSSLRSAKNPWISQLRGTKLVDRNWISDEQGDLEENKFKSDNLDKPPIIFHGKEDGKKIDADTTNPKKNKKVEFCKTEVHFAAESGKFNIVETDGKPPPNDIFRKRRRSTGSTNFSKELNSLPETKFGDSTLEKNMLTTSENVNSISEKIEAELNELSRIVIEALPQSKKPETDNFARKNSSHSWLYNVAEEPVENSQADNAKPRSILKNYGNATAPIENEFKNSKVPETIESRQRSPISDAIPVWQSTVILRNKRYDDTKGKEEEKKLYSSDGESELQTHIRNLRKIDSDQKKLWESSSFSCIDRKSDSKRRSLPDDIFLKNSINIIQNNISKMSISTDEMPSLSVAERVKQVEQLKSNNYSTKINFRSGEVTVVQNGTSNTEEPRFEEKKKIMTSWANQRKLASLSDSKPDDKKLPGDRTLLSCGT